MKKKATISAFIFILDVVLILISFFSVNYLRCNAFFLPSEVYAQLLILFSVLWLAASSFVGKFRPSSPETLVDGMAVVGKSALWAVSFLALMIVLLDLQFFSRAQVIGTCFLLFFLESVSLLLLWFVLRGGPFVKKRRWFSKSSRHHLSYLRMAADFILITAIFFEMNFFFRNTYVLTFEYQNALFMIWAVWLWAVVSARKFEKRRLERFLYFIAPSFKAFFLMMAGTAVFFYFLNLSYLSRGQIFGTLLLFMIPAIGVSYIYYRKDLKRYLPKDVKTVEMARVMFMKEGLPTPVLPDGRGGEGGIAAFETKLTDFFSKEPPGLFEFVRSNIDPALLAEGGVNFLNTSSIFDIETMKTRSLGMLLNLHRVNDFRRLNYYFLTAYQKMAQGGYFFGCAKMKLLRKKDYLEKFHPPIGQLIFWMSLAFYNVFPYIPGLKQVYFAFTKGRKRVLSKAEILGRLYFCGFDIVALKRMGTRLFYIAKKVRVPSIDENPSYSPVIKLRRIGMNGKIIRIYKFRTMHPYAEYLQEYVYERNKLEDGGKLKDDFRVHPLGRWMRSLHVDELPQLVNLFRGELGLVGVRALSEHYFSLYPKELRDKRILFKPGCIPPYYADMPKSFDEIIESENRYLAQKEKHPFLTDVRYFFRAMKNLFLEIIIKPGRSKDEIQERRFAGPEK